MNVRRNSRSALRAASLGLAALIGAGAAAQAQVYLEQVDRSRDRAASEKQMDYFTFGKDVVPTDTLSPVQRGGGVSEGGVATVEQRGSFNRADTLMRGVGNVTAQDQRGTSNESLLSVIGTSNAIGVSQNGSNNRSDVAIGANGFSGSVGNTVDVQQHGSRNASDISVMGNNNAILHTQNGSGLSGGVHQVGDGKTVVIQQFKMK